MSSTLKPFSGSAHNRAEAWSENFKSRRRKELLKIKAVLFPSVLLDNA